MNMNWTNEAWEEEQMSNLGCKSVSDLIALAKGEQEKPFEIQIWFHAQKGERGEYLAEPHVVIKHHDKDSAYREYESIVIYDPFNIQLVEYDGNGDGDILEEGGTWEMSE